MGYQKRHQKECEYCKLIYFMRKDQRFCSRSCKGKGSIGSLGNLVPENGFKKGNIPWNLQEKIKKECVQCFKRFEVIHSQKDAKHCSIQCANITRGENNRGELAYNWIGGSWLTVRKRILEEQNYTCQECGWNEPEIMEVNHIKPKSMFPELARTKSNLEVLCPNCHRRTTNIQFKRNNN